MKNNPKREKALIDLVVGLQKSYVRLRTEPDLVGLRYLASTYRDCNMPERAGQIEQEVSRLMECRTSVLNGGIIGETSGYGGTDETNPHSIDIGSPAPVGVRADC